MFRTAGTYEDMSTGPHHVFRIEGGKAGCTNFFIPTYTYNWLLTVFIFTVKLLNEKYSDEERRFMCQNRPSKSNQLPFDQGVQIVIEFRGLCTRTRYSTRTNLSAI